MRQILHHMHYTSKCSVVWLWCRCTVDPAASTAWSVTTDTKVIRLTRRRVVVFPTAAARLQFLNGDCDAADFKNFPGWYPRISDSVGSSERDGRLPRWQNPACAIALTVSSLSLSNLVTLPSRLIQLLLPSSSSSSTKSLRVRPISHIQNYRHLKNFL